MRPAAVAEPAQRWRPAAMPPQASFLPMLFWLGLPELGRNLVFLVRNTLLPALCTCIAYCSCVVLATPTCGPPSACRRLAPPPRRTPARPPDDPVPVCGQLDQGPGVLAAPAGPGLWPRPPQVPGRLGRGGAAQCQGARGLGQLRLRARGAAGRGRARPPGAHASLQHALPAAPCCPQEYGLPSSHTLNTLCLNYFAVWCGAGGLGTG